MAYISVRRLWNSSKHPIFTKAALDLLPDEHYRKLQAHLTEHPDDGAIIQDSGGKIRWAVKKQGKRGGVRVIILMGCKSRNYLYGQRLLQD